MALLRGNTYVEGSLFVEGGLMISTVTVAGSEVPRYSTDIVDNVPWGAQDKGALVMFSPTETSIRTSRLYIERKDESSIDTNNDVDTAEAKGLTESELVGLTVGKYSSTTSEKPQREASQIYLYNYPIKLDSSKTKWVIDTNG